MINDEFHRLRKLGFLLTDVKILNGGFGDTRNYNMLYSFARDLQNGIKERILVEAEFKEESLSHTLKRLAINFTTNNVNNFNSLINEVKNFDGVSGGYIMPFSESYVLDLDGIKNEVDFLIPSTDNIQSPRAPRQIGVPYEAIRSGEDYIISIYYPSTSK